MGSAVTSDSGILIEMETPAKSIDAFAAAIRKLSSEPNEVTRLSRGALDRAGVEALSIQCAGRMGHAVLILPDHARSLASSGSARPNAPHPHLYNLVYLPPSRLVTQEIAGPQLK